MKRTGKFGFVTEKLTYEMRQQAGFNLAKLIDDGRDYFVNYAFLRGPAETVSVFAVENPRWKCRAVVWLMDYRDAQVGEYCIVPRCKPELALFSVRLREPTPEEAEEDGDALPVTQYVLEAPPMVFEGIGVWKRVE